MIPLFPKIGEQGRVPLSLSACFLEAGGFLLKIPHLVGTFFDNCDEVLVGGNELGVVFHQFLENRFFVDRGGGKVVEVSLKGLNFPSVNALVCLKFVCFSTIAAAFAAPNLTETLLACAFFCALLCTFL